MKVYILVKEDGEYDDYTCNNLGVFASRQGAMDKMRALFPGFEEYKQKVEEFYVEDSFIKQKKYYGTGLKVKELREKIQEDLAELWKNRPKFLSFSEYTTENMRFSVEEHELEDPMDAAPPVHFPCKANDPLCDGKCW